MHDSDVLVKPSLLAALDTEHRISSKWIAKETGKLHKNVLRDIEMLKDEAGSDLSTLFRPNGDVAEVLLGLPPAILVLSRYEGVKAIGARRLILDALTYFIHRAPYVEALTSRLVSEGKTRDEQIAWLQNDVATLSANQKRAKAADKPKTPKRIEVPYYVATLTGFQWQMKRRGKTECEAWQWGLGLIPWIKHITETLNVKMEDSILYAEHCLLQKFSFSEMSEEAVTMNEQIRQLAKDMVDNSEKYTQAKDMKVVN